MYSISSSGNCTESEVVVIKVSMMDGASHCMTVYIFILRGSVKKYEYNSNIIKIVQQHVLLSCSMLYCRAVSFFINEHFPFLLLIYVLMTIYVLLFKLFVHAANNNMKSGEHLLKSREHGMCALFWDKPNDRIIPGSTLLYLNC